MRIGKWTTATALALLLSTGSVALAQGHGKARPQQAQRLTTRTPSFIKDRDREVLRGWYGEHQSQLPPGLAKKDRLRPAWKRQLVRRGTLPPGLQSGCSLA